MSLIYIRKKTSMPLLFNIVPGAERGYSVFKLDKDYTGYCLRVRRSSDGTEQDFGFVTNYLDTDYPYLDVEAILAFCEGSTGTVPKWYAQDGSGQDAFQTTVGSQPIIVDAGTLVTVDGGLVGLDFVNRYLTMPDVTLNADRSMFGIFQRPVSGVRAILMAGNQTAPVSALFQFTDNKFYFVRSNGFNSSTSGDTGTSRTLLSGITTSGTGVIYKNQNVVASGFTAGTYPNTLNQIGRYSTQLSDCVISEVLLWNNSQDANKTIISDEIEARFNSIPAPENPTPESELNGKEFFFCGDSITYGVGATTTYADLVTAHYNGTRISQIGGVNLATSGTTMQKRSPINYLNGPNMVDLVATIPTYDSATHGLLFISYLTNDVGINLTNYTVLNYIADMNTVIDGVVAKGWPLSRIKFNLRFYVTLAGLDYGMVPPADFTRYNAFNDAAIVNLDSMGIQYFDHYPILSVVPSADSHLDGFGRHPDNFMQNLCAENIIDNMTI